MSIEMEIFMDGNLFKGYIDGDIEGKSMSFDSPEWLRTYQVGNHPTPIPGCSIYSEAKVYCCVDGAVVKFLKERPDGIKEVKCEFMIFFNMLSGDYPIWVYCVAWNDVYDFLNKYGRTMKTANCGEHDHAKFVQICSTGGLCALDEEGTVWAYIDRTASWEQLGYKRL